MFFYVLANCDKNLRIVYIIQYIFLFECSSYHEWNNKGLIVTVKYVDCTRTEWNRGLSKPQNPQSL